MNHTRFPKEDHLPDWARRDNKVTKSDRADCPGSVGTFQWLYVSFNVFYRTGFRRPSSGVPRKDFSKVNRKSEALRKKKVWNNHHNIAEISKLQYWNDLRAPATVSFIICWSAHINSVPFLRCVSLRKRLTPGDRIASCYHHFLPVKFCVDECSSE